MKVNVYQCDYDDYSWFVLCKELGLVESDEYKQQKHSNYFHLELSVSTVRVVDQSI